MTLDGWLQIAFFTVGIALLVRPLGGYMMRVFRGQLTFLGPIERGIYRLAGIDPATEQGWLGYALAMIVFSIVGFLSLYALQRTQNLLPLNPRGFDAVPPDLGVGYRAAEV